MRTKAVFGALVLVSGVACAGPSHAAPVYPAEFRRKVLDLIETGRESPTSRVLDGGCCAVGARIVLLAKRKRKLLGETKLAHHIVTQREASCIPSRVEDRCWPQ